jgi:hypothetical protein
MKGSETSMFKSAVLRLMAILLAAAPLIGAWGESASAATSRVAVIQSLSGTVQVQKAGGTKLFRAFAKMTLNEGDVLTTSADSSAELQFANGTSEDDRMTVSANAKLTFSKLSDRKGTRTKVTMWNGTAWVDVKSIATKNDEFTLETPTAVMGVRGTHLVVVVDPLSKATNVIVLAGIVRTQPNGEGPAQDVKPGDQALITGDGNNRGDVTVATLDVESFIQSVQKSIIPSFLQAAEEIAKENLDKRNDYAAGLDPDEQARQMKNVDNLIGVIAKNAVDSGIMSQEQLFRIIRQIQDSIGVIIDPDNAQLTLTEKDREKQELLKRKQEEARKAAEEQKKKEEEERRKLGELTKQLDEAKKKQAEENNKKAEEKKKKALEEYEKQLSEAERARFLQDQAQRASESSPSPSPVSGGGSAGSGPAGPADSASGLLNDVFLYYMDGHEGWVPVPDPLAFNPNTHSYHVQVPMSYEFMGLEFEAKDDAAVISGTVNGYEAFFSEGVLCVPLLEASNDLVVTVQLGGKSETYSFRFQVAQPDWNALVPYKIYKSGYPPLLMTPSVLADGSAFVQVPSGLGESDMILDSSIASKAEVNMDAGEYVRESNLVSLWPNSGMNTVTLSVYDDRLSDASLHTYTLNLYASDVPYGLVDWSIVNTGQPEAVAGTNRYYKRILWSPDASLELVPDEAVASGIKLDGAWVDPSSPLNLSFDPDSIYGAYEITIVLLDGSELTYSLVLEYFPDASASPEAKRLNSGDMIVNESSDYLTAIDVSADTDGTDGTFFIYKPVSDDTVDIHFDYGLGNDVYVEPATIYGSVEPIGNDTFLLGNFGLVNTEFYVHVFHPKHPTSPEQYSLYKTYRLVVHHGDFPDSLRISGFVDIDEEERSEFIPGSGAFPLMYTASVEDSELFIKPVLSDPNSSVLEIQALDGDAWYSVWQEGDYYGLSLYEADNMFRIIVEDHDGNRMAYELYIHTENPYGETW